VKSLLSLAIHAVLLVGLILVGIVLTASIVKSTIQDCQLSGAKYKMATIHYADSLSGIRIEKAQEQAWNYQKPTAKRRRK